ISRDRLTESTPLVRPAHRVLEAPLGQSNTHRGNADASAIERGQEDARPAATLAQHRVFADAAVLVGQLACVRSVPAHFLVRPLWAEARRLDGHDEGTDFRFTGAALTSDGRGG